jgi:hypothetical protein
LGGAIVGNGTLGARSIFTSPSSGWIGETSIDPIVSFGLIFGAGSGDTFLSGEEFTGGVGDGIVGGVDGGLV